MTGFSELVRSTSSSDSKSPLAPNVEQEKIAKTFLQKVCHKIKKLSKKLNF